MPRVYRSAQAILNLRPSTTGAWYRITNKAGAATQVHIYDEIGMWGISAQQFVADLAAVTGDVEVHLNTPGGEVFDGIAIYNALRQRQPTIVVDGLAASIGSVIAMAAAPGKLIMEPNAQLMIHDGFAMAAGNAAELTQMAALLDKASENIASIYAERSGKPQDDWRAAMRQETWYSAQEAVAAGLADSVRGVTNSTAVTLGDQGDQDSELIALLEGMFRDAAAPHSPMTGTHSHPHPAYGSQGGDTSHDHQHTHDGDASHSHSHAAAASDHVHEPVLDAASVDESAWDGSKAMANGAASDDPAAFYAGICAGQKAGDKSTQDAWALPYKYHPSDPPNAAGVKNALARLSQTEGLTNAGAAKATLEAAMKKVNPDWEPPSDHMDELISLLHNHLRDAALKEA